MHECHIDGLGRKGHWQHCSVCNGRVHLEGCTSRRNKNADCCEARHRMLFEQGHRVGLSDSSLPMLETHN